MFSNVRSLLGALASAMNLINSEVENHHERTAYLTFFLAKEMGLKKDTVALATQAAVFHDIGFIAGNQEQSLVELENDVVHYAQVGSRLIRDIPSLERVSRVVAQCQIPWSAIRDMGSGRNIEEECPETQAAVVIHIADTVAFLLKDGEPVLNQLNDICAVVETGRGTEFQPEAVDALLRLKKMEYNWLDVVHNPSFLLLFTGEIRGVSLRETAELTKLVSRIIDYRSSFTAMHSAGVAASARKLAELYGMPEEDCLKMEIAGNLHDLGKLVVPNEILEKPGKLTQEEFNVVKEHPYFTRLILMRVDGFEEIADWAALHHEKLNGSGYPFHLGADQLDTGSRIMAVADIFSAITEERPYRKGMEKEQVLRILQENAERGEICPDIVNLLERHYEEVDHARDIASHIAGKRYFDSLKK